MTEFLDTPRRWKLVCLLVLVVVWTVTTAVLAERCASSFAVRHYIISPLGVVTSFLGAMFLVPRLVKAWLSAETPGTSLVLLSAIVVATLSGLREL